MKFRKNYESTDDHPGLECKDPSLTRQSEAEACDINYILKRVEAGGLVQTRGAEPIFGDFSEIGDYFTSLNTVIDAQTRFDALPAQLRARFENDPNKILGFVNDPSNREEAIKLGLTRSDVKMPEKNLPPSVDNEKANPAPKGGQ